MESVINILKNCEFHVETDNNVSYVYMDVSQIELFKRLKNTLGFKCVKARQCENTVIVAILE